MTNLSGSAHSPLSLRTNTPPIAWLFRNANIEWVLFIAAAFGFLCQLMFVPSDASASHWRAFSGSVMLSLAAAAIGAILAFLFGVPRYSTPETGEIKTAAVRINNNFQEVSDWLTKIIIGIGLVQIRPIISQLTNLVTWLSTTLQLPGGYVGCIVALYVVCGFLVGYIWTVQTYFRKEMEYLERQTRLTTQTLAAQARSALESPNPSRADLDFWYSRVDSALEDNPTDPDISITKARYDAEFRFKLDDAIATMDSFRKSCEIAGKHDRGYALGLYWLARFMYRKDHNETIKILQQLVSIERDAKSWLHPNDHFRQLEDNEAFKDLLK
jgi:hypothetical protein